MKASKLLLAAALFTGLASFSFAGPGPQFCAQQAKNQTAKVDAAAKVQPAAQVAACSSCACCAGMKKA